MNALARARNLAIGGEVKERENLLILFSLFDI